HISTTSPRSHHVVHTVIETVLLYIPLSLLATSIWERKLIISVQWVYYTHDGKYRLIH
ncbi:hypothetical protein PIROE2DRAFT_67481, partial [Piromyces sp. E2]